MNKLTVSILTAIFLISSLFAEETSKPYGDPLLALSTENYPVTPGDIYSLTYLSANQLISQEIVVESDYTINLNIFGKIKAENLTFPQLRRLIEDKVSKAYPDSTPFINVLSTGRFQVYVKGEVKQSMYLQAWGLTCLSHVIYDLLTPYASIRDIVIESKDGTVREYDLFQALRFGAIEEDPYLRVGDTIVVHKRERGVMLYGVIRRPGKYQLLQEEELKDLIEYYGDGLIPASDTTRIRIDRFVTDSDKLAETFFIDISQGYDDELKLMDMDQITVFNKIQRAPVVYLEGAVQEENENGNSNNNQNEASHKITIRYKEGETLYNLLEKNEPLISPLADLQNTYIYRPGQVNPIPANLEKLLYAYNPASDIKLEPYDRIVIPFRQFYVTVTGGVNSPGKYPYMPDKSYHYYINLAGGVDPEKGSSRRVNIADMNDNPQQTDGFIQPEDGIFVPFSFSYHLLRFLPVTLSAISTIIAIIGFVGN